MSRVLAIDYGQKRIGIALSDPTATIAFPLTTLRRRAGKRPPWAELLGIIAEHDVGRVVIGLPLGLGGQESDWTAEVRSFGERVTERSGLPVYWIDERFSSVQAEQVIRGMGLKKKQREDKERVDSMAAALLLQTFLQQQNGEVPSEDA